MAAPGGTTGRSPQPRPTLTARDAGFAVGLSAQRTADRRDGPGGDTVLRDSNQLDTTLRSPLELGARSYTTEVAADDDIATPASALMEMEAQRAVEQKMREAAEQFVGAPITPTIGPAEEPAPEAGKQAGRRANARPEAAAQEEEEFEQAQDLQDAQQAAILQREQRRQAEEAAAQEAINAIAQGQVEQAVQMWKAAKFGTAVTLVGILVTIAIMNIQMINQFTFKHPLIPKLNIFEIAITIVADILLPCLAVYTIMIPFIPFLQLLSIAL